ncbi:MAG: hypothetical protein KC731_12250 [Myxococcales bacterium]|nr:hypothetical protein [Myxococcales bacterium]
MPGATSRALTITLALLGVAACEKEPEAPQGLRLVDDGEIFVARVVSRLYRGRYDLLELALTDELRSSLPSGRLETWWGELTAGLGSPPDEPELLQVSTTPVAREDGTMGFFGLARFAMPRGVAVLRIDIVCATAGPSLADCRPPYLIAALDLDVAGASP